MALAHEPQRCLRYAKCFRYLIGLDPRARILEIGCGEGTGLSIAADMGFHNTIGIEVSLARLAEARSKLPPRTPLVVVEADCRLPFDTAAFDVVLAAAVIEHVTDPQRLMMEIARVLRGGGTAVITSDCWQWRVLTWLRLYQSVQPIDRTFLPSTFYRMFRHAGLQTYHSEGFPVTRYVFLKSLARPLERLVARAVGQHARDAIRARRAAQRPQTVTPLAEAFQRILEEHPPRTNPFMSTLRLLFSDENVFAMTKSGAIPSTSSTTTRITN